MKSYDVKIGKKKNERFERRIGRSPFVVLVKFIVAVRGIDVMDMIIMSHAGDVDKQL